MIELFTADTPNGKKISIMLEEINFKYKVTKINLFKDEQFSPDFKKISPFSKIPVIIDHETKQNIFESGAILIYLGEKSEKFYNKDDRTVINQWLMGQMAYVDLCWDNTINFIIIILEKVVLEKIDILKLLNRFTKT